MTLATSIDIPIDVNELVDRFEYITRGLCVDESSCEDVQGEMFELCVDEFGRLIESHAMVLYQYLVAIGVETRKVLYEVRLANHETHRFGLKLRKAQLETIRADGFIPSHLIKDNAVVDPPTAMPELAPAPQPTLVPLFRPPVLV